MTTNYLQQPQEPTNPSTPVSGSSTQPSSIDDKTAFYNRRFKLLQTEVLELDPASATTLSTSSLDDDEMVRTARRSVSLAARALTVAKFRDDSEDQQRSRWNKMSADQQRFYLDAGYSPPAAPAKNFVSWWEWPQHVLVNNVIDPIVGTLQDSQKFQDEHLTIGQGDLTIGDKNAWYNKPVIDVNPMSLFEDVSNLADDVNSRHARYQDEISGQSQKARFNLKIGRAKYLMEKNGIRLTEDEWQNLFYRYGAMNVHTVNYRQKAGEPVNTNEAAPPGSYTRDYMNPGAMLSAFADWGSKNNPGTSMPSWISGLNGRNQTITTRTENFAEPNTSGKNVPDNLFDQFRGLADEVNNQDFFKEGGAAAWDRADNDADYVRSNNAFDAFQMLDGNYESYELARAVASGMKVADYLVKQGLDPQSNEMRDRFTYLQNNVANTPQFKNAVNKIKGKDSLLTWGTSLASGLGIPQDSAAYTGISGTADAINTVVLDPMNVVGPAVKWTRIAAYGIAPSEIALAAALDSARTVERTIIGNFKNVAEGTEGAITIIKVAQTPEIISRVNDASNIFNVSSFIDRLLQKGIPQTTINLIQSNKLIAQNILIDAEGYPTQFLLDYYDEIQSSLLEQANSFRQSLASPLNGTRSQIIIDGIHTSLEDIDVLSSILMRTGKPILDTLGSKTFNWLQKTSLRGTRTWMDRVVQGFEDARNGVPNAIVDLMKDLPYGRVQVPVLQELETKLLGQGLGGIKSRADLWKWLQTDGLYRLGTGDFTGLNIRGFGNGAYVRNTWRVFGRLADDAYFTSRHSLAELPRLTSGTQFLRSFINITEDATKAILATQAHPNLFVRTATWGARKGAKILWALANHVPENKWLPLAGEKGVVEFSKLLNYGVLAGMDKETLDKFMEEFIRGIPIDNPNKGVSNLFESEIDSALSILDNGDESIFDEIFAFDPAIDPNLNPSSISLIDFLKKELQQTIESRRDPSYLRTDTSGVWSYIAAELGNVMEAKANVAGKKLAKLSAKDNEILKIVRSYMPQVTNPTLASRIFVEKKFMRALFDAAGVLESAEGRKLADDFLNHVERFRYTPNDEDILAVRNGANAIEKLRIGVMPISNYAGRIGIPNVKEFIDVMQRISMTSRVLRRLNGDFLTAAMTNVWKPLTLMRLGFIPRAAGEEYLAFYARRGIWAPMSSVASNIAENRRGFIFGTLDRLARTPNWAAKHATQLLERDGFFNTPLNHLGKLPKRLWGEASRAGLGEELTNLATVLQFKNKAEYMHHVAETLGLNAKLGTFDYLQLASTYHTARIVKSMRNFEFQFLPKQLQRGVLAVLGQTDNAALAEGLGLIDLATINKAMKRDTAMLLRNPLGQQAFADQQASIGGMIAPANGLEDSATQRLTIKKSSFDRSNRGEVVLLEDRQWNTFDPADGEAEAMLHDVAPIYTLIDNDPIMVQSTAPLLGKLPEDDFLTHVEPLLAGTQWEVNAAIDGFPEHVEQVGQLLRILGQQRPDIANQFVKITTVNGEQVLQLQVREFAETVADELAHTVSFAAYATNPQLNDAYSMLRTIAWAHYQTLTEEGKTNFVNRLIGTFQNLASDHTKEIITNNTKDQLLFNATGKWGYESIDDPIAQNFLKNIDDEETLIQGIRNEVESFLDTSTEFDRSHTDLWTQTHDPANPYYRGAPHLDTPLRPDPIDRQIAHLNSLGIAWNSNSNDIAALWTELGNNPQILDLLQQAATAKPGQDLSTIVAELKELEAIPKLEELVRSGLRDAIAYQPPLENVADPRTWNLNKQNILDIFNSNADNSVVTNASAIFHDTKTLSQLVDVSSVYDDLVKTGFTKKEIRQYETLIRDTRPGSLAYFDQLQPEQIIRQDDIETMLVDAKLFDQVLALSRGEIQKDQIGSGILYGGDSAHDYPAISQTYGFNELSHLTKEQVNTRFSDENIALFEQYVKDTPDLFADPDLFGSTDATQIIESIKEYRRLQEKYIVRTLNADFQYYVDKEGNLVLGTNYSGRNAGRAISTAQTQYNLDFAQMWGGGVSQTVLIDREAAKPFTRGLGADRPNEIELATGANDQIVIPKGKFIMIDPGSGRTESVIGKRTIRDRLSRGELLEELNRIVAGSSDISDSNFWRVMPDGGVRTFVQQSIENGSTVRIPVTQARRMNVDTIAGGLRELQSFVQSLPKKTKRMIEEFMQGDIAFKGETGVSEKFIAKNIDLESLPAPIRQALKMYPTGSRFEDLVIEASRLSDQGNNSLMEALEIFVSGPKRIGQSLLNDTPISIADPVSDRAAVVEAAINNLHDPDYRFFVDSNPRSIQNPITGQQVTHSPFTNTTSLYTVMMDADTVNLFKELRNSMDDSLRGFEPIRTALIEKGATPDEIEIINELFVSFDSELTDQMLHASTQTTPLTPINNIAFTDFDQANRISSLLTDMTTGAGEFRPYVMGHHRPESLPFAQTGKINVANSLGAFEKLGDHPSIVKITDDTLMNKFKVFFPDEAYARYNEAGQLDDFGQHVVQGVHQDEAFRVWGETIADLIFNMFTNSSNGSYLHEILSPIHAGTFGVDALAQVPMRDFPRTLLRPTRFVAPENAWQKFVTWGFGEVIGPAVFSIVRSPMYMLGLSDGLEWARAVTGQLRDSLLDSKFDSVIKRIVPRALDPEDTIIEIQNAWSMIPMGTRQTIGNIEDFTKEINGLVYAQKLDPESVLLTMNDEDLKVVLDWVMFDANLEKMNMEIANARAMSDMLPFIDDHKVRSFFQEKVKNLVPFEFAQESFLKRWVKTTTYSPEAFRRVQLLVHGISSAGFVHDDPTSGQKVFAFPMTESLQELMSRIPGMNAIFGQGFEVPVANTLTGKINNVLPGVPADFQNLPALSPIGMIPATVVAEHFPEAKPVISALSAGRAVNASTWKDLVGTTIAQFVPANYQRLWTATFQNGTALSSGELNRATITAMAQMESQALSLKAELAAMDDPNSKAGDALVAKINSLSIPEDASDIEIERYIQKATNWARTNMLLRAFLGFVGPITPQNEFANEKLAPEFGELIKYMDPDEALSVFLSEHPEGQPWSIFVTTKTTKAPLTPSARALNWMTQNRDFMDQYPKAAPWLMPQAKESDEFSQQAFTDFVSYGFKLEKDPEQWYRDLRFASAANLYFPNKLRKDVALENTDDSATRRQITDRWNIYSDTFMKQHPIFANQIASQVNNDAELVLRQLSDVINFEDKDLPKIEHLEPMRKLVRGYDTYVYEYDLLKGQNSKGSREKRNNLRQNFLSWGQTFVTDNPEVQKVWTSLILPATNLKSTAALQAATKGN